jgi:transcriptional regulator with XRE-family HTH domain
MGKAGRALRQVLETYSISQNRLAVTMGLNRATVNQWFNETRDPLAESIPDIVTALEQLNPAAAKDFVDLYLGRIASELPSELPEVEGEHPAQ